MRTIGGGTSANVDESFMSMGCGTRTPASLFRAVIRRAPACINASRRRHRLNAHGTKWGTPHAHTRPCARPAAMPSHQHRTDGAVNGSIPDVDTARLISAASAPPFFFATSAPSSILRYRGFISSERWHRSGKQPRSNQARFMHTILFAGNKTESSSKTLHRLHIIRRTTRVLKQRRNKFR